MNGMPIYCPNPPPYYYFPEFPDSAFKDRCGTKEDDCKPEDTGVVIYKTKNLPPETKNANVHYWLAWNGGTTDANAIAILSGVYDGRVAQPAGYTHTVNEPEVKELKPCEYDFQKLHQCISDEVRIWKEKGLKGEGFGLCYEWTSYLWSTCKSAAKK